MISDAQRELRDLLRARLVLVTRTLQARRSITALLDKYNVPTPAELPTLPRLQAELHPAQRSLLVTHIKRLEAELRVQVLDRPDVQRLVWVPGIGARVAYTLLLEIDDIGRFPSVRHFHSYCRLVPGSDNSGGKTKHKRSRDGNRYLKIAFHHAAIRALQYFPEIRTVYQAWVRRKGKPIARALVAKELAQIVYAVLTIGEAYNGRLASITLTQTKQTAWPRRANPPA
jgi:transposase